MATTANTWRLSARLASRYATQNAPRRTFRTSPRSLAASNYVMPALSPTMQEGNISTWHIKEGDSYSPGDVILEIETDKATMDVEAQDDGVLFKITKGDGSKGVKIGERIAVMAETGDDLGSLEVPAEESSGQKQEEPAQRQPEESAESSSSTQQPTTESSSSSTPSEPKRDTSTEQMRGQSRKQRHPLFPAVQSLLHANGLSDADADSISASGPYGRLLKGDVLAHLGKIQKDYPTESSKRLEKLSHLDLSNIQLASPPKQKPAEPSTPSQAVPESPRETEIAVPISLSAVIATQKRVQDTLGIFLPLSTFIARASEMANTDLPASKQKVPTAEDLFNSVLGLDTLPRSSRGHFVPQITGISPAMPSLVATPAKKADIIDFLAPKAKAPKPVRLADIGVSAGDNVFSVLAKTGEEGRATEYLDRMKVTLEREPGRLVL